MYRCVIAATLFTATLLLSGCGSGLSKVEGVVKLDGAPVEGATVTFAAGEGGKTYTGLTDAQGNFSLIGSDGKPGALPGDYKITVVKTKGFAGEGKDMSPGSDDYKKAMADQMKGEMKKSGGGKGGPPGKGSGGGGIQSELPAKYAEANTSGFTAKVPTSGPVTLDLVSK